MLIVLIAVVPACEVMGDGETPLEGRWQVLETREEIEAMPGVRIVAVDFIEDEETYAKEVITTHDLQSGQEVRLVYVQLRGGVPLVDSFDIAVPLEK